MFKNKLLFMVSTLIILSIFVTSCGAAPTAAPATAVVQTLIQTVVVAPTGVPKGGDTLTFAISLDPETLDNTKTTSATPASILEEFLLEGLVYFDQNGNVKGQLAESWVVSPDETQITFTLRKGVKFHDGTDFNADAVKFQFDRIMDPATASPALAYIPNLKQVDVIDPSTVKFTFTKPDASFWTMLTYAYFGFNSPTAVKAAGDQYGRHPVGTGPFMFDSWIPGSQITLVKYPGYQQWRDDTINKGPALADKVILYVIPEAGTVAAALQTGEILVSNLTADILPQFVSDPNFKITINKQSQNIQFLEFNNSKAPFDDVNFRKAISYAIDRHSIVLNSRGGYSYESLDLMAPGIPMYDPKAAQTYGLAYDPQKAKDLLAQDGWVAGSDGILVKDGMRASWTIKSYSGYTYVTRTLEVIQQNLQAVGIETKLEISDWSAFFPSLLDNSTDMDLMRWGWNDPGVLTVLWRSPGYRGHMPADATQDALLDSLLTTMDPAKRAEIASQAQDMVLQNMVAVGIQADWTMVAVRANVQDYHLDFLGLPLMVDVWLSK